MSSQEITAVQQERLEWVEPTITRLDVRETANAIPERANDFSGSAMYPDCTRS